MRQKPGPSDLRYSNLQPNKELREIMKPKPMSEPEEGEVESTEDELPPEEELTNVTFPGNENNVRISNPSLPKMNQTNKPGPAAGEKPNEEKQPKRNHPQSNPKEQANRHTVAKIFPWIN